MRRPSGNRDEWPNLFGEALLGSAALDRLTHGAHFLGPHRLPMGDPGVALLGRPRVRPLRITPPARAQ